MARTNYGLPGVYNSSAITLSSGDGAAVALDASGRTIVVNSDGTPVGAGSILSTTKGNQQTTITSSTAETTIVTAVAATYLDVYGLVISNTSASACNVTIKDDTAGTTRFIFAVPAGDVRGFMVSPTGAHLQATLNKNWTATCSASVASISITALYVKRT